VILENFNLLIKDGSFTVLVGPSGCGKTTALRIIAGLEKISQGKVFIGEEDITATDPGNRGIAMVFQNYAIYPHMTVRKNIEFGLKNYGMKKDDIAKRINNVIELVGLKEYIDVRPSNLSGGQRQRVALARAISKNPKVFLMDEPLSNLDAKLRNLMRGELIDLHKKLNTTFVYVTHDQIEAMTMGDHIIVMNNGKIMQQGNPREIYNDPDNVFVASFIGDPAMNFIPLGKYRIGFRPRNTSIEGKTDPDGIKIAGEIRFTEALGNETVYMVSTFFGDIRVCSIDEHITGEKVKIDVSFKYLYLFDDRDRRIRDDTLLRNCINGQFNNRGN
jgi:sn-glycerol 3-phosphate transport system ATP-binding protein